MDTEDPYTNNVAPNAANEECIKSESLRKVNIPYILNGELYEIQTQDGENVTVKCCNCPSDRVYRGSVRSTGNFHMHIKRRHPNLLGRLHDMKVIALLERRDRLMRNRKTQRGNKNIKREHSIIAHQSSSLHPYTPVKTTHSLMDTYKLKIHTAFQRHQQQKQQQQQEQKAAMHSWTNTRPFTVLPVEQVEPINFSCHDTRTLGEMQTNQQQQAITQNAENEENAIQSLPLYSRGKRYENDNEQLHLQVHEQQEHEILVNIENDDDCARNAANASFMTISTPSQSRCSSISQSNLNPLTQVKHEVSVGSDEAINLSMHSESGLSSTSTRSSGIGSSSTFPNNNKLNSKTTVINPFAAAMNPRWEELLMHVKRVEESVRELHGELRTRNQIDTNRMLLDIAKFKYLHPGFTFSI